MRRRMENQNEMRAARTEQEPADSGVLAGSRILDLNVEKRQRRTLMSCRGYRFCEKRLGGAELKEKVVPVAQLFHACERREVRRRR